MIYTVSGGSTSIDWAPEGVGQVLQNVRTILLTPQGTLPLDRAFGVDYSALDRPMPAAKAQLSAQIIRAIRKYEPRARVVEVKFAEDALDGRLTPEVLLEVVS